MRIQGIEGSELVVGDKMDGTRLRRNIKRAGLSGYPA